jgi:type IV pilus assembly protein PilB
VYNPFYFLTNWWDDYEMKDASLQTRADIFEALSACKKQVEGELLLKDAMSVVRLLEYIFEQALVLEASDIHINPTPSGVQVRVRVDGELQDIYTLPISLHPELIARLKILAGLRTDEHLAAQDGRFRIIRPNGVSVDIRISVVPVYYGENAILRLLTGSSEVFTLTKLGFTDANAAAIMTALVKPYGMILATGPTGSGKTSTLYTLLKQLDAGSTSIITIEDPIEYAIAGVNQIQVQARTGLTFANGLRSILRQDPDTIMVGEIRDAETAGLAVNVALTGHLVLSTLHTNDAATTLPRLLDMKVEAYLIASTVNIAIGQRLVRRLCPACRTGYVVSNVVSEQITKFAGTRVIAPGTPLYRATGCLACNQTGYQGRVGIHEVLTMTPRLREAVLVCAPAHVLRNKAIEDGMVPLVADGFMKVKAGVTSLEEIFKLRHE